MRAPLLLRASRPSKEGSSLKSTMAIITTNIRNLSGLVIERVKTNGLAWNEFKMKVAKTKNYFDTIFLVSLGLALALGFVYLWIQRHFRDLLKIAGVSTSVISLLTLISAVFLLIYLFTFYLRLPDCRVYLRHLYLGFLLGVFALTTEISTVKSASIHEKVVGAMDAAFLISLVFLILTKVAYHFENSHDDSSPQDGVLSSCLQLIGVYGSYCITSINSRDTIMLTAVVATFIVALYVVSTKPAVAYLLVAMTISALTCEFFPRELQTAVNRRPMLIFMMHITSYPVLELFKTCGNSPLTHL